MKFAIIVVMLALTIGAQSSVLPLAYYGHPLSYTAVSGPTLLSAGPAPLAAYAVHTPHLHVAPAVVAAPLLTEGNYVAKTRGAVHIAPLPGHLNSAASINLEPAPGTI